MEKEIKALDYWKSEFEKSKDSEKIILNYCNDISYKKANYSASIDKNYVDKLNDICKNNKLLVYVFLVSTLKITLSKYTMMNNITIGIPCYNAQNKHKIMSNRLLPLTSNIDYEETYIEYMNIIKSKISAHYKNQAYLNLQILSENNINDIMDLTPISICMKEIHQDEYIDYICNSSKNELSFLLDSMKDNSIKIDIIYNENKLSKNSVENLYEKYLIVLSKVLNNCNIKIKDIELLLESEKRQILFDFNDTKADYKKDKTIHELFEEQVERTPDNIAVIFGDKKLTYRELNEKSNSLAKVLRSKGVKADSIVAIMLERSLEMIIGIMGILKAGGAYLPIDPNCPDERKKYMLSDSMSKVVLSKGITGSVEFDIDIIDLSNDDLYNEDSGNLDKINNSNNLAYIIYTSGTTGKPKGVMIEHRSLVNRLNWMQKKYPLNEKDMILQKTTYVFDVSVWEILWWSLVGAGVCMLEPNDEKDPVKIIEAINKQNITTIHFVPSMLDIFLDCVEKKKDISELPSLKQVFCSGEALNFKQVSKFYKEFYKEKKLINLYGPTEATIDVSYFNCIDNNQIKVIPIGKPIDNIKLYILNKDKKMLPIGVIGELYISGDGVARGYLNRAELTAEKFIDNPFETGTKMYKTGDLARWLPDGNIEYLGRIDNQVKIRGFRIELGEVENRLLQHEWLKEAVVLVKENKIKEKYICAYVVSEKNANELNLKSYLKETLPEYMIPTYFVQVEKMPLTANGKLDRRALPEPSLEDVLNEYEAPRNDVEEALAKIWSEVLAVERVGINDNFFEIGGHSLKATVLMSKIHKELNKEIQLKELFKSPTIKELSKFIEDAEENSYLRIEKIKENDYYETSSSQKRMYMLQQFDKDSIAYNIPAVFELEGEINKERIEETLKKLVKRHDALRTYFETFEDEIVQKLDNYYEFKLEVRKENEDIETSVNKFIKVFMLDKAPLFRAELVESQGKTYLLIGMHHIISDGVSMSVLINDFKAIYDGEELEPLRLQYKDFAAWQNDLLQSEEMKKQEEYWINMFSDEIPVLNMPTDYERPAMQSFEGDSIDFEVNEKIAEALRKLARETGTTMHMILLSVFNIVLSKYSGQEDIVVGTPIAGRSHADIQNIIGMFVNTLALRNKPEGYKKYIDFLKEVKENSLSAYENQSYQFEELIEKLDIKRDTSRNPLFDVMFNIIDTVTDNDIKLDNILLKQYNNESKISKFDLTLNVLEKENVLNFNIEYCTKIFNMDTIERLSNHYVKILNEILKNTEIKIAEVDLLLEEERKQILYDFNDTKVNYLKDKTVYELFEEQVEKTPDNIAVIFEDKKLTYNELNEKANSLARVLRNKGIKADSIVGIMLERSLELIIGIIGVLKAGGAYMPIDSSYPAERIEYILKDSRCNVLLTEESLLNEIEFFGECIGLSDKELFEGEVSNLEKINTPNDLIYVIYTSGTTGNPKGTIVKHYSFTNLIQWYQNEFQISEEDNILLMASVSFDLAQKNIYAPLISGGKLTLANKGLINYEKVSKIISENRITIINCAPSAFNPIVQLNKDTNYRALKSLKYVFLGGEPIKLNLLNTWRNSDNYHAEIVNTYGPTECTDIAASYRIKSQNSSFVPIGKPINNAKVYILNKDKKMLPIGVAGELYISGVGVSRGYLDRPELTAEKFIENPFEAGSKMYKTGDLARWLSDGNIDYLGRIDHQVKIRGFRIELGEIENRLLSHAGIKEAIVMAKEDEDGNKYLCSYIVDESELTISELREYMGKELPDYMIPSYFIKIDKMPLTPNGKIDRKELLKLDNYMNTGVEYKAPRDEIEKELIEIWSEVLKINKQKIGVYDNFFEIGGNSIDVVRLLSLLRKKLGADFQMRDIFENSNIANLSKVIMLYKKTMYEEIKKAPKMQYYDASPRMIARWKRIKNYSEKKKNLFLVVPINEELDLMALNHAINIILQKHEILRTSLIEMDGTLKMKVNKFRHIEAKIIESSLSNYDVDNLAEVIKKEIDIEFDLREGLFLKVWVFKLGNNENIVVLLTHHIVSDNSSLKILKNDLLDNYKNYSNNATSVISFNESIQYKDYVYWLYENVIKNPYSKQKSFWINKLKNKKFLIKLPYDFVQTDEKESCSEVEAKMVSLNIKEGMFGKVNKFCSDRNLTINMLILSISNLLLCRWCKTCEITVGVQVNGRSREEFSNVVGYLSNFIYWNTSISNKTTISDFLNNTKLELLDILENQDYPNTCISEDLHLSRSVNVSYNYMDSGFRNIEEIIFLDNTKIESYIDLKFGGYRIDNQMIIHIIYNEKLFKASTINTLRDDFLKILNVVIHNPDKTIRDVEDIL